jgi:hypothetical protein
MESINNLVDIVFKDTPNVPNAFLVELDGDSDPKLLYDLLVNVLLLGIKKLYGKEATPAVFIYDEELYALLNEYMQSIGYNLNYKVKDGNLEIWFDKYVK